MGRFTEQHSAMPNGTDKSRLLSQPNQSPCRGNSELRQIGRTENGAIPPNPKSAIRNPLDPPQRGRLFQPGAEQRAAPGLHDRQSPEP